MHRNFLKCPFSRCKLQEMRLKLPMSIDLFAWKSSPNSGRNATQTQHNLHTWFPFFCRLLLQERVKFSLNVSKGVVPHVVHLTGFPALLPLLWWDVLRRRGRDKLLLPNHVLLRFLLDYRAQPGKGYGAALAHTLRLYSLWLFRAFTV